MKREEALSLLNEIIKGWKEDENPLQGFDIHEPSQHSAEAEELELQLIMEEDSKGLDYVKSVADKHGLAVRREKNFVVAYTPTK